MTLAREIVAVIDDVQQPRALDHVVEAVATQQDAVAVHYPGIRHLGVDVFARAYGLREDALAAIVLEVLWQLRADVGEVIQKRLVARQLDHRAEAIQVGPGIPDLSHEKIRTEERRGG